MRLTLASIGLIAIAASLYLLLYLWRRRGGRLQDMLAGVLTRADFERHAKRCIARAVRRKDSVVALVAFRLNDFAAHRHALGRFAMEDALITVTERLFSCIGPDDMMTNLDDGTFGLLLEHVRTTADAVRVAVRIQNALSTAISLAGEEVVLSASIGIAMGAPGALTVPELLARAREARERCQARGVPYVVFDDGADRDARAKLAPRHSPGVTTES